MKCTEQQYTASEVIPLWDFTHTLLGDQKYKQNKQNPTHGLKSQYLLVSIV